MVFFEPFASLPAASLSRRSANVHLPSSGNSATALEVVEVLAVEVVHDLSDVQVLMMGCRELHPERPLGVQHEPVHLDIVDGIALAQTLAPDALGQMSGESLAGESAGREAVPGRTVAPDHDQPDQQADAAGDHGPAVAEQFTDEHDDDRDDGRDLTSLVQARREQVVHDTLTQWA